MNYETSWQEKTRKLPAEIFRRLELLDSPSPKQINQRALLLGKGTGLLLADINKFLDPLLWKIFVGGAEAPPEDLATIQNNLIFLKGQSATHLKSLPKEMFHLIISLWDLSSREDNFISYLNGLYRLLKKRGRISIITYLDGAPELPLGILKEIIRRKKLPLKIFKSALPDSTDALRKMFYKAGFGDICIWKDNIPCIYADAEDLYHDIFPDSGNNLFMDNIGHIQRVIIKETFIREIRQCPFPLEIGYNFAGGVGVKP